MKPIAVVTNNISSTLEWLTNNFGVDEINLAHGIAKDSKTGQKYILILEKEQAYGFEFGGYLISPFYESLEDVVRSRVR